MIQNEIGAIIFAKAAFRSWNTFWVLLATQDGETLGKKIIEN